MGNFRIWPFGNKESEAPISDTQSFTGVDLLETNGFFTDIGAEYLSNVSSSDRYYAPYSIAQVALMARNPMDHIEPLRRWARWAYYSNGTVAAAIDALPALFPLNYVITAKPKKSDDRRDGYYDGADKMRKALKNIRYKEVIRDAIFRCANEGMYIGYLETRKVSTDSTGLLTDRDIDRLMNVNALGGNISVIPLPVEYTRIIGRRNNCYEVAFDLRYFNNLNEDTLKRRLQGMPRKIQDGWKKYQDGGCLDGASWLRLDWQKTIVVKIKSGMTDPYGVPFAVAALDDIEYAKYFISTKRSVLDSVNNRVYYETFPEGKDKGISALSQKQQQAQHDTVKRALNQKRNSSGVAFFSLASGTKMDSLPVDISILDEENENSIKDDVNKGVGVSSAALDGSSSGNYATATLNMELVANKVYTWIEDIVNELNKVLRHSVVQDSKYIIEFRILPVSFLNRDVMVKNLADLYARGHGSLSAWIAAVGLDPDDYVSLMDYELDLDFENKYPVHKTSFTMTGKDSPEYEDIDKNLGNPSTASTAANNGNASPSPSD